MKLKFAVAVSGLELSQELGSIDDTQHFHRQEKARRAGLPTRSVRREPSAGNNTMDMGMVQQVLTPGVQDCQHPNPYTQVTRVRRHLLKRLGGRAEQDTVDDRWILQRHVGQKIWHGKHDVKILHRQEVFLPSGKPVGPLACLALGAVAVATRVVCLFDVSTLDANAPVSSHPLGAAMLETFQHVTPGRRQRAVASQIVVAMSPQNVGYFKSCSSCSGRLSV